ncbi:GNAT family N-acetyltransferase [Actinotalea sp. BY-33]|uniref:GNAT family N-acetyltransferase n=1 Tax=Actinotalea soli TaxID=2819234 RepID=A0A939LQ88_9CELL|nr:GNAT family N-acetyltransferase [Actinotalea soli]
MTGRPASPASTRTDHGRPPTLPGWSAVVPSTAEVPGLTALLRRHELAARGRAAATERDVETSVAGERSDLREHLVLRDEAGVPRAWATVHDRAAARVVISVVVDPDLERAVADPIAADLFAWAATAASDLARGRGVVETQMDSGSFEQDERQQAWLEAAGYALTRTWFQMSRPVTAEDPAPAAAVEPGTGLAVRSVRRGEDGMPEQTDLRTVHDVLEEAFTDHFNYHPETFDQFVTRLREDPGHRWDHWWIAEITDDEGDTGPRPAGALVGSVALGDGTGSEGSYVEYLGVLRSARGRGAAKALLATVIADAAERGRDRVGLEVDADSPTGAVDLYRSTGFVTSYVTQSWHRDLPVTP